ncbi:hypothetical protein C6A85_43915, partial [Mycobacterium sp. ITM-2017-0098]
LNSTAGARLRRRRGPASGHRSDPDWRPSDDVDDVEDEAPSRAGVMVATEVGAAEGEPDYLDVDVVEDSGALPISEVTIDDELAEE